MAVLVRIEEQRSISREAGIHLGIVRGDQEPFVRNNERLLAGRGIKGETGVFISAHHGCRISHRGSRYRLTVSASGADPCSPYISLQRTGSAKSGKGLKIPNVLIGGIGEVFPKIGRVRLHLHLVEARMKSQDP